MASQPTAAQRSSSRWGSFLSSVESRLDTILAEEDTANPAGKTGARIQDQPGKKDGMAIPITGSAAQSRTPSTNRAQERLNEKLARAMANRNLGKKGDASLTSSGLPSRTASPTYGTASPRASAEFQREKAVEDTSSEDQEKAPEKQTTLNGTGHWTDVENEAPQAVTNAQEPTVQPPTVQPPNITRDEANDGFAAPRPSTDSRGSLSARPSVEITRPTSPSAPDSPKINGNTPAASPRIPEEYEKTIEQMRSDNEAAELRRQEETHQYLERIDTLQAKLQYLTKEAAEIAKTASSEAKPGSPEQKLASKDEKIALLIEEGQKLSQTELRHMSIIKKLRAKSREDEKAVADAKKTAERFEETALDAQERAKRAETAEKRAAEKVKALSKFEKDFESVKADRDAKDSLVRDLQLQLSEATSAAKEAEGKANAEALDKEKRRAADLSDELSSVKTEKELAEKQYMNELRESREMSEREKERAKVAEIERQGEQNILESRLESYRARAEEASAGQGGDVQAKLLRQIETLQNQYAIASENWQGIEGSLLSRVTVLEKERDDISNREADIRRKARETNIKLRRMEEELERLDAMAQDRDHELSSRSSQLSTIQERLTKSEAEVAAARSDLKAERESWETRQAQRLEEDRIRITEELVRSPPEALFQHFRTESPVTHNRKRKSSNDASPHSRRLQGLQGLATTVANHAALERPLSRHSSNQRVTSGLTSMDSQGPRPLSRNDSMSTVPQLSVNKGIPETPSVDDVNNDDFFDGVTTPATPERTINDLISVSTAGAGPSVQLVERMSAAVRRLESEKAAHKDELSRLSIQRDEAREQLVELMRDNEEKRASDERVKALENEIAEVKERYLTTLEMLGEKSEKVEELKADVEDVKAMYRELVENTMK